MCLYEPCPVQFCLLFLTLAVHPDTDTGPIIYSTLLTHFLYFSAQLPHEICPFKRLAFNQQGLILHQQLWYHKYKK